ncbi:MAG: hypothetical protein LKJ80_01330 [Oscillibacter sp.]|nr:hypothetical protein [Oscillibacter sp.]
MEYLSLVNQIIQAEHNAKSIAQEAAERAPVLEEELQREKDALRTSAMNRAREKAAEAENRIRAGAENDLRLWDEKLVESTSKVEAADEKYRENWVDTLFSMIVKGTP